MKPALNIQRLVNRVVRARSVVRKGIRYGLGHGGMDPDSLTPSDDKHLCDCSGFALAWTFNLSRKPKKSRPYWIATETVYSDAMSAKPKTFIRIDKPVAGCAVVYPDRDGDQGHCAIVTDVTFDAYGRVASLRGIDCSSGQSRRIGEAITERDISFFLKSSPIFVILREDLT